ncbi:MAG: hypothetical protein KAG92_06335 [Deltaproteobacteria bacterium]|nr:hypothetical protein [Deltaproteobacteria bacterium]
MNINKLLKSPEGKTYTESRNHILTLKEKAKAFDGEGIKEILKQLIPEYQPEQAGKSSNKAPTNPAMPIF